MYRSTSVSGSALLSALPWLFVASCVSPSSQSPTDGSGGASATPWVTSDASSIVSGSPITVSSARFTASLAAKSVTTFVGKPE